MYWMQPAPLHPAQPYLTTAYRYLYLLDSFGSHNSHEWMMQEWNNDWTGHTWRSLENTSRFKLLEAHNPSQAPISKISLRYSFQTQQRNNNHQPSIAMIPLFLLLAVWPMASIFLLMLLFVLPAILLLCPLLFLISPKAGLGILRILMGLLGILTLSMWDVERNWWSSPKPLRQRWTIGCFILTTKKPKIT